MKSEVHDPTCLAWTGATCLLQDNAVLIQQLAELQKQCQAFVIEAEALRGQVAKLEGARDAAEGGLAAAQLELEQLKHVLRCELGFKHIVFGCAYRMAHLLLPLVVKA